MLKVIILVLFFSNVALAKKKAWVPVTIKPPTANITAHWLVSSKLKNLNIFNFSHHNINQLKFYQFIYQKQSVSTFWLIDHLSDIFVSIKKFQVSNSPRSEFLRQLMLDQRQILFNFIQLAPKQNLVEINYYDRYLSLLPSILTKMDYSQAKSHLEILQSIDRLSFITKYKDASPNDLIIIAFQEKYGQQSSQKLNELLSCLD